MSSTGFCLGLDVAPRHCGLYLLSLDLEEAHSLHVDLGGVNQSGEGNEESLWRLHTAIVGFCFDRPVELSVIEGYAFNSKNFREISGERAGIAKLTASRFLSRPSPIIFVPPHTVKKFMTGYGKGGDKALMEEAVTSWNLPFESNHEADAAALALMGVFILRTNKLLSSEQSDIIVQLREKFPQYP